MIDNTFHRMETPKKVKISLSGCTSSCAESNVRDIGLIGTPKGWRMLVGELVDSNQKRTING